MKVLVDEAVSEDKRRQIVRLVTDAVGPRPDADSLVVSVVKLSPGHGWSVFVNDVQDAPLVDAIEAALKKAGL